MNVCFSVVDDVKKQVKIFVTHLSEREEVPCSSCSSFTPFWLQYQQAETEPRIPSLTYKNTFRIPRYTASALVWGSGRPNGIVYSVEWSEPSVWVIYLQCLKERKIIMIIIINIKIFIITAASSSHFFRQFRPKKKNKKCIGLSINFPLF